MRYLLFHRIRDTTCLFRPNVSPAGGIYEFKKAFFLKDPQLWTYVWSLHTEVLGYLDDPPSSISSQIDLGSTFAALKDFLHRLSVLICFRTECKCICFINGIDFVLDVCKATQYLLVAVFPFIPFRHSISSHCTPTTRETHVDSESLFPLLFLCIR